jgi:hypothetical protein
VWYLVNKSTLIARHSKITQIGIFGLKTNHLATLLRSNFPNVLKPWSNSLHHQGDRMGEFFAYWADVFSLGRFFKAKMFYLFPLKKLFVNLNKNGLGYTFGRFFHKVIWSPCSPSTYLFGL